jgi:DNA excision repair protein ERCC-2
MGAAAALTLSVGDLCSGRLSGRTARNEGGVWVPGRAARGTRVHQRVEARLLVETPGLRSEVELAWRGRLLDHELHLRGRADLLHPLGLAEEIKTVIAEPGVFRRYRSEDFPGHCMQALLYSWMADRGEGAPAEGADTGKLYARLRLVNLLDESERVLRLESTAPEVLAWIEAELALYLERQESLALLCGDRRVQAAALRFPFRELRPGQKDLIDRIEQGLAQDRLVVLNAPTGLGKSVSVLFPALRQALSREGRVFYCTAKNTGREAALTAFRAQLAQGARLGCVAMASRESLCPHDVYFCHEEHCPFLRRLEDRLPEALKSLEDTPVVTAAELGAVGRRHTVCPHELALALTETRDLVIGDFNYVFDPGARIRRLFVEGDPSCLTLLVDEAHNLPARARGYFSMELRRSTLRTLLELVESRDTGDLFSGGPLRGCHQGMKRALEALLALIEDSPSMVSEGFRHEDAVSAVIDAGRVQAALTEYENAVVGYLLLRVVHGLVEPRDPLVGFYFDLSRFMELLRRESPAMHQLLRLDPEDPGLEVNCSWAGDHLLECLGAVRNSVLFSATLKPWDFHLGELGLGSEPRTLAIECPSPFPVVNRELLVHAGLSTRFRDRDQSLEAVRDLVTELFAAVGGNLAVFLPSFSYLRRLNAALPAGLPVLVHDGEMEPQLRQAFLRRLCEGKPRLLLTVMGGIFAEAVDYPGEMLRAALLVGPGLPQLSHERELARLYYDGAGEEGYARAYRLPGLCRVIQAAGRVIRTPTDRGCLVFADDRFLEYSHRSVLEEYYDSPLRCFDNTTELLRLVRRFYTTGTP